LTEARDSRRRQGMSPGKVREYLRLLATVVLARSPSLKGPDSRVSFWPVLVDKVVDSAQDEVQAAHVCLDRVFE